MDIAIGDKLLVTIPKNRLAKRFLGPGNHMLRVVGLAAKDKHGNTRYLVVPERRKAPVFVVTVATQPQFHGTVFLAADEYPCLFRLEQNMMVRLARSIQEIKKRGKRLS